MLLEKHAVATAGPVQHILADIVSTDIW